MNLYSFFPFRPLFPFTAYSELGERRLNLTCISDAALEFLIARELAALLGSRKLAECRQSSRHASEVKRDFGNFLPPRLVSRFSCLSLFGSLYLAYQVIFQSCYNGTSPQKYAESRNLVWFQY